MFYYDSTYLLLLPAIVLAMYAQSKVKSTYNKYTRVKNSNNYSGYEVARKILDSNGLNEVKIEITRGVLSDHYDPRTRILRLSPDVHNGNSISAAGIAAHECGHAIQHGESYIPLQFRNTIAPVASIASNASWLIIMLGFIMNAFGLVQVGIILFSVVVLFQVVTLPVEFNASSRAVEILEVQGLVPANEIDGAKKVLNAAALTYVAAALTAVMQLLRMVLLSRRNRD